MLLTWQMMYFMLKNEVRKYNVTSLCVDVISAFPLFHCYCRYHSSVFAIVVSKHVSHLHGNFIQWDIKPCDLRVLCSMNLDFVYKINTHFSFIWPEYRVRTSLKDYIKGPGYRFTKGLTQNLNLRTHLKLEYYIKSLIYIQ